jgi:hypothetical protein
VAKKRVLRAPGHLTGADPDEMRPGALFSHSFQSGLYSDLEPSNLLDVKWSDDSGYFTMEGNDHNKPNIAVFQQPVLTIYHNCDYDNKAKICVQYFH